MSITEACNSFGTRSSPGCRPPLQWIKGEFSCLTISFSNEFSDGIFLWKRAEKALFHKSTGPIIITADLYSFISAFSARGGKQLRKRCILQSVFPQGKLFYFERLLT